MFNDAGDAQRAYLARVLPWPQDGDEPAYINVHWTFEPSDQSTVKRDGQGKPRLPWTGQACRSVSEAANAVAYALKNENTRDVYVCMSSQREAQEKVTRKGKKRLTPVRSQANAVALKSLFLDIDFKGGEHGYDTPEDAVNALQQFLSVVGLPNPSALVRTGGGLHVYWTLLRPLSRYEWEPLASALAEATKRHNLKCDTQCTIDSARVLRIPGTSNRKTDPPRPVKLVGVSNFDYTIERLAEALEPYRTHQPVNGKLLPPRTPLVGESDLSAGIETPDNRPIDVKTLLPECPFFLDTFKTGGKDHTNPLWNLTTLASTFMADGRNMAHLMGRKHPGYTVETTNDLYDRKEREKLEKGLGWPACATIALNGSRFCHKCPHFGKGKSPLHFAKRVVPFVPSAVTVKPPVTPANDLPKHYTRDANGIVYKTVPNADGNLEQIPVHHAPMIKPWLQRDPHWVLHFTTFLDREAQINIELEHVGTNEMRKVLQSQGFMIYGREFKELGEFLLSWINKLKETKEAVVSTSPFGWNVVNGKVNGFVYGGHLWTPKGQHLAPNPDFQTAKRYTPTGELQPFLDMADMITSQGRPEIDAILATAFAAPLVQITGHKGLLLSAYSLESGVGKSTATIAGQAVWGSPRARQMLDDTTNSVMGKIGELRHLPIYWDELKTEDQTRRFVSAVFQMDQGREKARMRQNATQREVGEWNTLMVCCSNDSLMDFVTSRTRMTTAGLYRIFEYEVGKRTTGRIPTSDATRMTAKLDHNYGHAGLIYSKFLGSNYTSIDKEVSDFQRELDLEVDAIEDERYWTSIMAVLCMGARYANQLGLTKINEEALKSFLVTTLGNMRGVRNEQPVDMKNVMNVSNVLAQFLGTMRARHTITTNRIHVSPGKPAPGVIKVINDASRLDGIVVHLGKEDKMIRISSLGMTEWLQEKGYSRHLFTKALTDELKMRMIRGRIASGTEYANATEYLLEIDLAGTPLANFIDEA